MDLSNENVIHQKKDGIEYLQFKKLLEYPEIKHAYVIGLDKTFKIFNEECEENNIARNSYKQICEELKLDYNNIVNTNQNHTDNIQIINEKINKYTPDFNVYENTDGLITNRKNLILSTINADCILIIFYDPIKKVIANVHSGWRGTIKRISTKTIQKMKCEFGCNPKDIICCMSPSIRKDHFEVDKDVYNIFIKEFKDLDENIYVYDSEKDKYNIDTIAINRIILENEGLEKNNIIDSGICSVCEKDIIHSYRAHGEKSGRATLLISMEGE